MDKINKNAITVGTISLYLVGLNSPKLATIPATLTARIADGLESGPPIANLNELKKDNVSIATQALSNAEIITKL